MEYVQMTLDDWAQMKQKLKQELLGVKQSFVRIGYVLRQIDDQKLYEQDGYKSIAEFAQAEYGLGPSITSRFMSINREYSIDGYSEQLRPEYAELGRSQLEEMLKLPDSDRQMIQPETSREDIRELKRFNKSEPETGVADDVHQLVEKFYQDNPEILNAVFTKQFDEQTVNQFIEVVNPGGNRSYKKGIYFLMMYENRVVVKKFGDTPRDMTWWEFYRITMDIFGQAAAGAKTWQNYFGGEDDEKKPVLDNEPGGEGTATEIHEPENDGGAVGETGTDESQEEEKGGMEDHGDADGAGTGQEEDDTDGKESGQADCEEPAERTTEQTGEESQGEEIAPAQESAETLEKEEVEDDETGKNQGDETDQTAESEPKTTEREQTEETEVIEAIYGTRKEYMDRLSEQGMAEYMADEYKNHRLLVTDLADTWNLCKWLSEKVDRFGQPVEEE